METLLVEIFALLLGTSDQKAGLVLYSINNFHTWLSLIGEAIQLDTRFVRLAKNWNKKVERLRPLNDTRTRLAHHTVWESKGTEDFGLKPGRFDTRSRTRKYKPLMQADIDTFVDKVSEIHIDLHDLFMKIGKASRASFADKSGEQPRGPRPSGARSRNSPKAQKRLPRS